MPKEKWKPIPGWEYLYAVSSEGRVKRLPRPLKFAFASRHGSTGVMSKILKEKILKPNKDSGGYLQVVLQDYLTDRRTTVTVHRLVLSAFRRLPLEHEHGMHRNDIRTDNRLTNLKWGTRQQNHADMLSKGRGRTGKHTAPLPLEACRNIQSRPNERLAVLAKEFGISKSGVSKIRARQLKE